MRAFLLHHRPQNAGNRKDNDFFLTFDSFHLFGEVKVNQLGFCLFMDISPTLEFYGYLSFTRS